MIFEKKRKKQMLPVSVIIAASNGEVNAMKQVLNHYEGYIKFLSKRVFYDVYGNAYIYVDEDIRQRLQMKLVEAILTFEIA